MKPRTQAALESTGWVLLAVAFAALLVLSVWASTLGVNCRNYCERAGYPAGGRMTYTQVLPPAGTCGCLRVETPQKMTETRCE